MSDRLRALTGIGPMSEPHAEAAPDEDAGTSERVPPDGAGDELHPRSEATGGWPVDPAAEAARNRDRGGAPHDGS